MRAGWSRRWNGWSIARQKLRMKSGKKCGVVAGEVFADLLMFLKGVLEKRVFWCGVLVVSLW